MDKISKGIGKRLKIKRLAKGLSQLELAEKIGVSQSYISYLEIGSKVPSGRLVMALAFELGGTKQWWFKGGKQ